MSVEEITIDVDVTSLKKASFFRPGVYTGSVKVVERKGDYSEAQTADFEYDTFTGSVEFDNYSRRGAPRHNRLGEELPGVVDCYQDVAVRHIQAAIDDTKHKNKGIER